MWIRKLMLENWGPYRGKTVLTLDPKPYAVVASRSDDAERSNWVGKSMLLEAIHFVLFGKLNPDRNMGAEGWITDGEKSGSVSLEFDTGNTITRSRKLGKSTQLHFEGPFGVAKGDEAQALIHSVLGISDPDDFLATCYFQQRQMARLVLADPSTRMGYVSAWFQLGPLERGEEILREELSKLCWQLSEYTHKLDQLSAIEAQYEGITGERLKQETSALQDAKEKHARLQALLEKNRTYANAKNVIAEYEALQKVSDETTEALRGSTFDDEGYAQAKEKADTARETWVTLSRQESQKEKLAAGQFDGNCPVALIECPAKKEINLRLKQNAELYEHAKAATARAQKSSIQARFELEKLNVQRDELVALRDRSQGYLQRLQHDRQAYDAALKSPPAMDFDELRDKVTQSHDVLLELSGRVASLQSALDAMDRVAKDRAAINSECAGLSKRIATYREALVIFGKQGAQRRVAERALQEIQQTANEMLAECGIQLEVDVCWSREGSGMAKTCDACGNPFPTSQKVKTCEKCNTPRGANLINKLDIALSEQSGAAEDLVGAGIQLAAALWLRTHRGVLWSSALLDEPFGQLDRANRRSLSTYLSRMLTRPGGFEQAFIISHTTDTDAFPGLIRITHDGKRSTAEVV
jgi:DNA repair exonuclease SbcCD ATPase subunit